MNPALIFPIALAVALYAIGKSIYERRPQLERLLGKLLSGVGA